MKKLFWLLAICCLLFTSTPSHAAVSASVNLYGSDYLQSFNVTNNSTAGLYITKIVYSLGTPDDNIATWQYYTGGGVASDSLGSDNRFQTITWSGLFVAPGNSYSIGSFSLDIDLIVTVSPLSVTDGVIDYNGNSLRNAYFGVEFNDGMGLRTVALNETGWTTDQNLRIPGATVPLPGVAWLFGSGLLGLLGFRRKISK